MFKSLARATLSVAKTTCNASALRVATQIPKRFMGHHIPAVDKYVILTWIQFLA